MEHDSWLKFSYRDALEKHGYLDMEDLQFEAEFLTWDQASQNSFTFNKYYRNSSQLGPIQSGLDSISSEYRSSTGHDGHPTLDSHTT